MRNADFAAEERAAGQRLARINAQLGEVVAAVHVCDRAIEGAIEAAARQTVGGSEPDVSAIMSGRQERARVAALLEVLTRALELSQRAMAAAAAARQAADYRARAPRMLGASILPPDGKMLIP